jgi:hypothetical protein
MSINGQGIINTEIFVRTSVNVMFLRVNSQGCEMLIKVYSSRARIDTFQLKLEKLILKILRPEGEIHDGMKS